MFTRFSSLIALALLVFVAALTGSPTANASPPVNPLTGAWHGGFTTDGQAFGYVNFNIADNGKVSGSATYYPGGVTGTLVGHVNAAGFGAFTFQSPPNVIPYLLFASINADGELEVIAPVPWDGGFTVFATLQQ